MSGTATDCLYSTVKNVSGGTLDFSFLPPHGKRLDDNEEYTVFGNIQEAVIRNQRVTSKRYQDALEAALNGSTNDGDPTLALLKTPSPILYNEDEEESRMLQISGGSSELGTTVPCTDSSV